MSHTLMVQSVLEDAIVKLVVGFQDINYTFFV